MYSTPRLFLYECGRFDIVVLTALLSLLMSACGGASDGAEAPEMPLATAPPPEMSAGSPSDPMAAQPQPSGETMQALSNDYFDCGVWGKRSCGQLEWEDVKGGIGICDRGLECKGSFLKCQTRNGVCRNSADWPQRWTQFARDVHDSWAGGAFRQQRELAVFEPLSWTTILTGHNAFNNRADGYPIPNQRYSMTDQLRMGARALMLDVHDERFPFKPNARLSHEVASSRDRHFGFGIIEIKQWLDNNPDQVVILQIENVLDKHPETEAQYEWIMERYLENKMLYREDDVSRNDEVVWSIEGNRWPTLDEMRQWGKQVIVTDKKMMHLPYVYKGVTSSPTPKNFYPDTCNLSDQGLLYQGSAASLKGIEEERLPLVDVEDGNVFLRGGIIAESCGGVSSVMVAPNTAIGGLSCVTVSEAVNCGNAAIILDYIGVSGPTGVPDPQPTGDRFSDLIWSWQAGVRGWDEDNRAALLQFDSGESSFPGWMAQDFAEQHHFACGLARVGDPVTWKYSGEKLTQETTWKVTRAVGPYSEGAWRCFAEFGPDYVFNVPVNSIQNRGLEDELKVAFVDADFDAASDDVWLAYRDINPGLGENEVFWSRENLKAPCVKEIAASPSLLWPPNHKLVTVNLESIHECSSEPECRIVAVSADEKEFLDDDFVVHNEGGLLVSLRAERNGTSKQGRTYTVATRCEHEGQEAFLDTAIVVPHDRKE